MLLVKSHRKCTSRNKNRKRWGIEFPLKWVKELQLEEAMMELEKKGNVITIRKVGESKSTDETNTRTENSLESVDDGPPTTVY